jgi:hypothetical protein
MQIKHQQPHNQSLNWIVDNFVSRVIKLSMFFKFAFDWPFVNRDCFEWGEPIIVPATTLLSQLI